MVNFDAARRQALGIHFTSTPNEAQRVAELKAGRLDILQRGAWQLPEHPTWREDPFGDRAWRLRFHSLVWLDPLRRADLLGDDAAAEQWWFLASSWIGASPHDAPAAQEMWSGTTVALRALELACGITVTGQQGWLVDSLVQHRSWLSDPSHVLSGPGRIQQHAALFVLGAVLEDRRAVDLAARRLAADVDRSYDEQGVTEEGAISPQLLRYLWWEDLLTRLDREGIARPAEAHRLRPVPGFLAHATSPLGHFARIGDTDAGGPGAVHHPWTEYAATCGREGEAPQTTMAIYDAGYGFLRSGWGAERPARDETYVTLAWGRQDKIHGHHDGGSVTYCSGGVQWWDDLGRFTTEPASFRRYVASATAHNGLTVSSLPWAPGTVARLLWARERGPCTDVAVRVPLDATTTWRRRVLFVRPALLLVLDEVQAHHPVDVVQRWHTGGDIDVRRDGRGCTLTHRPSRRSTTVEWIGAAPAIDVVRGGPSSPIGWTSAGRNRRAAVCTVEARAAGSRVRLLTAVGASEAQRAVLAHHCGTIPAFDSRAEELYPADLVATAERARRGPASRATTPGLTVDVEYAGDAAVVVARGPGSHYALYVLEDGRVVHKHPFQASGVFVIATPGGAARRIRVFNKQPGHEPLVHTTQLDRPNRGRNP